MAKNSNSEKYVVGIGEALLDIFSDGTRRLGGAPANFAYHASRFGFKTVVVSAVGNDRDGEDLISELEAHQLDCCIDKVDLPTGTVVVDISNANDPQYTINTDVAWSVIPCSDRLSILSKGCCAVCFGTLAQSGSKTRATIGKLLDAVSEECFKVYDVNLRKSAGKALYSEEIVMASISKCNVLKINADELDYMTDLFSLDKNEAVALRGKDLMAKCPNVKILIVTMGTEGSWVFQGTESSFLVTPKVEVKDTVGAGDSFTGAFVGSLLNGKTIKEAHQIAVKVSAYVCTQQGGMPEMPKELVL